MMTLVMIRILIRWWRLVLVKLFAFVKVCSGFEFAIGDVYVVEGSDD
jgi:hypothetical protein